MYCGRNQTCTAVIYKCSLEVAHIFVETPAQGLVSDLVACVIQIPEILYSKDSERSPKQCLKLYNYAFVVHQLHYEQFGESSVGTYFHALLIHCPVQHELVCSRSTNVETEERIFKSAESSAYCTDHQPENMPPGVPKYWRSMRRMKAGKPLQSLHQTPGLPRLQVCYLPTKELSCADLMRKHKYAYQAHLQGVGHFLVQGKGVW